MGKPNVFHSFFSSLKSSPFKGRAINRLVVKVLYLKNRVFTKKTFDPHLWKREPNEAVKTNRLSQYRRGALANEVRRVSIRLKCLETFALSSWPRIHRSSIGPIATRSIKNSFSRLSEGRPEIFFRSGTPIPKWTELFHHFLELRKGQAEKFLEILRMFAQTRQK